MSTVVAIWSSTSLITSFPGWSTFRGSPLPMCEAQTYYNCQGPSCWLWALLSASLPTTLFTNTLYSGYTILGHALRLEHCALQLPCLSSCCSFLLECPSFLPLSGKIWVILPRWMTCLLPYDVFLKIFLLIPSFSPLCSTLMGHSSDILLLLIFTLLIKQCKYNYHLLSTLCVSDMVWCGLHKWLHFIFCIPR